MKRMTAAICRSLIMCSRTVKDIIRNKRSIQYTAKSMYIGFDFKNVELVIPKTF